MFDPGRESLVEAMGKTWRVGRLDLEAIEEFIQWIRSQVGDPFAGLEKVIDKLPAADAKQLVRDAIDRRDALDAMDLNDPLIAKFRSTVRGIIRLFWILLRRHQPTVTLSDAGTIATEVGLIAISKTVENSAGSSGEGNARSAPAEERGASTGAKSTDSSSTAGPG